MIQYATKDDVNELSLLVRNLQGDVTVLNTSVGTLDTLVERINHIDTLKDVTITYLTEGDVLQYSSDGTWHNISLTALGVGDNDDGEGGNTTVDTAIVKDLIIQEGGKYFLSKLQDDTALGIITFANGLKSNGMTYLYEGVEIGHFIQGMVGGSGARIDKDGHAEMTSLTLREFLEVPELRFNRIDVVSGELWNSVAFGTIESVDTVNQIATLKLEEGEYGGLHVNDICRGIFHNLVGNATEDVEDDAGFNTIRGFSTSYFTPIEVYGDYNQHFRYSLKPGSTVHPTPAMKFAVYGNFTDESRQDSAYATRTYKRYLKGVNTWVINWQNIASQFGTLDGLSIPGAPNNGHLEGNGAYLQNVYMTGAIIEFDPEQLDVLKGLDAYSVSLTREFGTVTVDNDYNIISDINAEQSLSFGVQAFKGNTELTYSTTYAEGCYFLDYTAVGVTATMNNGVFTITSITNVRSMYIDITINCEGMTTFKKRYEITYQLQANALWNTYYSMDNTPDRPTGDGTTNGWHRNYTADSIWMSSKYSLKVDEGEWGDPIRFVGASVAGKDGQYTVFCYHNSSVPPGTPVSGNIPPEDVNGLFQWTMAPEERGDGEYTWMTQTTVTPGENISGWTEPIRLTGENGINGADGASLEYLYGRYTPNNNKPRPDTPPQSQVDDVSGITTPDGTYWTDNPQGVDEAHQYEWVSQRRKVKNPDGTNTWTVYSTPVIWSKWGEKGMDGDGYEYIFTRTADVDVIPNKPSSVQEDDFKPTIANGAGNGYDWTDEPKGTTSELLKAEWVCSRKKTDGIWSDYSDPALWANWGEVGPAGGNYQYRYKVSTERPDIPSATDNLAALGWTDNSELTPDTGEYVWQIQRFANPDGTYTDWTGLIRLTGADGKDGEDGNMLEFIYTRNGTGIAPARPGATGTNPSPSLDNNDWAGTSIDTNNENNLITWYDHPLGVTASVPFEYVCQRYKDKNTQVWEDFSDPGIWARYSEKGKDGDGYEYIYRTSNTYYGQSSLASGGTFYPPTSGTYNGKTYQEDEFVPTNYTDNPSGVNSSLIYEYVWTRKKKDGVWGEWTTGALWSRYAKDGADGEDGKDGADGNKGDKGDTGDKGSDATTYSISPGSMTIRRTKTGSLEPSSVTFEAYSKTGTASFSSVSSGYWEVYASNSSMPTSTSNATEFDSGTGNSITVSFSTSYKYYNVAYNPSGWPIYGGGAVAASSGVTIVYDGNDGDAGDVDSRYVMVRFRGVYNSSNSYYYCPASLINGTEATVPNLSNAIIRDYVIHNQSVWFVKNYTATASGITSAPSVSSSYWSRASSMDILTVNTLLADNAYLGNFLFSNNTFASTDSKGSANGVLSMNSKTGEFKCTNATITGTINATAGTIDSVTCTNLTITSGTLTFTATRSAGGYTFNNTLKISAAGFQNTALTSSSTGSYVYAGSTNNIYGDYFYGLMVESTHLNVGGILLRGYADGYPAMDINRGYVNGLRLPVTTSSSSSYTINSSTLIGSQIIYNTSSSVSYVQLGAAPIGTIIYYSRPFSKFYLQPYSSSYTVYDANGTSMSTSNTSQQSSGGHVFVKVSSSVWQHFNCANDN